MLLTKRGYLVFKTPEVVPLGEIVTDLGPDDSIPELGGHPFLVTAQTDRKDFDEQSRVAGWALDPTFDPPNTQYYRCSTD